MITPKEKDLLKFSGSVPEVFRKGSPYEDANGHTGVVIRKIREKVWLVCRDDGTSCQWPEDLLGLDLTDATGRAHLASWCLSVWWHEPILPGEALLRWDDSGPWAEAYGARWRMFHQGKIVMGFEFDGKMQNTQWASILDPGDPRLLADGSLLVNALILSLTARYLAHLKN